MSSSDMQEHVHVHGCREIVHHTPSCREHSQRLRNEGKFGVPGGRRLWRQMLIGFICAASLGVIMLILGSVFIGQAIKGNTSIIVMFCVLGMVCGLIILVGTGILGRILLSRKMRTGSEEQHNFHHHSDTCLHTCSIIYTPSQDQLNGPVFQDPPPAYEMVIFPSQRQLTTENSTVAGSIEFNDGGTSVLHPIVMSPPKYSIAAAPLPKYGDHV